MFLLIVRSNCDARYGNICYELHSDTVLTWALAKSTCSLLGGRLVDIEDEKENEIVSALAGSKDP